MITLRPDQLQFIADLRQAFRTHRSVLGMAPPGFGKTVVAASIVQEADSRGRRVIFAVHRDILMEQTAKTFDLFGIPYGIIQGKSRFDPAVRVHIASVKTLAGRVADIPAPDLLLADECHLAMSDTWRKPIAHYLQAGSRVLGLSGSPQRGDGKWLGYLFGALVPGPTTAWLMEQELLSRYRYFAPSVPDLTGVGRSMGDYDARQLEQIMGAKSLLGDAVDHWRPYAETHRALAFSVSRAHSAHLVEEFRVAGIRAAEIDGTHSTKDRRRIIGQFADREIAVLVNVELITTGFDLAAAVGRDVTVDGILQVRPTQSLALYLQICGRGLRPKSHPCIIHDHAGNSLRHGFPDSPREWSLDDAVKKTRAKLPPPPLDCEVCFCQVCQPAPSHCPHCGSAWTSSAASAQRAYDYDAAVRLAEVTAAEREAQEVERRQAWRERGQSKDLESLIEFARRKGYKSPERWAQHVWSAREEKRAKRDQQIDDARGEW